MPITNSESVQRGVRVKIEHDKHLQRKAETNKKNRHNQVATEINILIERDFRRTNNKPKKK